MKAGATSHLQKDEQNGHSLLEVGREIFAHAKTHGMKRGFYYGCWRIYHRYYFKILFKIVWRIWPPDKRPNPPAG